MFIYNLQINLYITVDKSCGRVYDTGMRKEKALRIRQETEKAGERCSSLRGAPIPRCEHWGLPPAGEARTRERKETT